MAPRPVPGVTAVGHFGCGALLGFVLAFIGVGYAWTDGLTERLAAGLVAALVVGGLAAWFGDRLWLNLDEVYFWWVLLPVLALSGLLVFFLVTRSCGGG